MNQSAGSTDYGLIIFLILLALGVVYAIILIVKLLKYIFRRTNNEGSSGTQEASTNKTSDAESADDGFVYFPVPDDKKTIFLDTMNGLRDFARIRGYVIELDFICGMPDRIGIKIIIDESATNLSKKDVTHDINDYINRLDSSSDFDDLPIVIDETEHRRLITAIRMRFSLVRHEVEMLQFQIGYLKSFYASVQQNLESGIEFKRNITQVVNVHHLAEQGHKMGNSYTVTDSPEAAVGENNSVDVNSSSVVVAKRQNDIARQIATIDEIINLIRASSLGSDQKYKAIYDLESIKSETKEAKPDQNRIKKWLDNAGKIVGGAASGGELIEKMQSLIDLFSTST